MRTNGLSLGGRQSSFTATYRYGARRRTLVARTKLDCDLDAERQWGPWDGEPTYSTPQSILSDLNGTTRRRFAKLGLRRAMGA